MSNLTLAKTTFENLSRLNRTKIGHNTTIRKAEDAVEIRYHDSVIAVIGASRYNGDYETLLWLTDAGWPTVTTRTRLNIILRDNRVPFRAVQENHVQRLVHVDSDRLFNYWQEGLYGHHYAFFAKSRRDGTWKLID